jgi:hypothetical protein
VVIILYSRETRCIEIISSFSIAVHNLENGHPLVVRDEKNVQLYLGRGPNDECIMYGENHTPYTKKETLR